MARDVDFYLLDNVFQPISDNMAGLITCFGLARISLIAAVVMQTVVLAWDANLTGDSFQLTILVLGTLAEYVAAQSVRNQIARMERQSRPGTMNIARITYRPFRLMWIGFAMMTAALGMHGDFRPIDLLNVGVGLMWILTVYFMCCVARPPSRRAARGFDGRLAFNGI